ncbi:hypothetical protein [Pseudomonas viridiflava]|uniref:hypothetical protein n=1 Tax=Pseudomonas viridiflava TaxID=33069 RepID=UPI000F02D674|nr:hypothetical protein [Pseudomonas viridiflava]
MKERIIFIDDEHDSRLIYEDVLQDMYGDEFEVTAIPPSDTLELMLGNLEKIENIVSIVIDEKLKVEGAADYQGSELVEAIRTLDSKMPLYILTSEITLIPPPFGSVEYVIDKTRINNDNYKEQCSMLMRRHINSFNDIKTQRAERFDILLRKSINSDLSPEETAEYEELNFTRAKYVYATEASVPKAELDRQQDLVNEIEAKLQELSRDN